MTASEEKSHREQARMSRQLLELRGVVKGYDGRPVLRGVDLAVGPASVVVVKGRSGAGKTTLLKIAYLLLRPDAGKVVWDGVDAWSAPEKLRRELLLARAAYVPQSLDLIEEITVEENIELSLAVRGAKKSERKERVREVAEALGISGLLERKPRTLSGGERQRVALARALAPRPWVILADEPFSFLDDESAAELADLFHQLKREWGTSFLVTTTELHGIKVRGDLELLLAGGTLRSA